MGNPTVTPLVEQWHDGGFIVSEANGHQSRESITLTGATKVYAGTILGQAKLGAATSAAGTNTGNGTMGAIVVGAGAQAGAYVLSITKAATNAGDFEVIDPQGDVVGLGTVGTAFSGGGLSFTLADGATDFAVGDKFTITVAAGTGKYAPLNLSATDGTQTPAGILFATKDATSADKPALSMARNCEVNASELIWPSGATSDQIAAGAIQLKALGIIAR
jgi:hypothetical protein